MPTDIRTTDGRTVDLLFQPGADLNLNAQAPVRLLFFDNISDLPVFDFTVHPDPDDNGFWKVKNYRMPIGIDFPAIYVPGCTVRLSIIANAIPVFVDSVHLFNAKPIDETVEFLIFKDVTDEPIVADGRLL